MFGNEVLFIYGSLKARDVQGFFERGVLGHSAGVSGCIRLFTTAVRKTGVTPTYTSSGFEGQAMLRIAVFVIGGVVALYLVWNFVQLLFGSYQDRRSAKNKQGQ